MAIDKNAVMNEARKFAAKGLYDKAIIEWKKLLSETPNDPNLFNTIGDLCIKKNSKAEAVDAYKRAADILAADGFTSKAIALYKKILNIDISRIEVHLALGDMNAEKGLTGNALQNYKYAADFYKKANKTAEALGIYQKMADLDPSNVAFRIKLADMYVKERMTTEAAGAYLAAADEHLSKDEIKEARHLFEKVLSIDPDNKVVYFKAGVAYLKENKFGEACKALKPAFESDPDNRGLSDAYLEALAKAGKSDDAERVITKILATDPGRTDLLEKLFPIYIKRGEFEKALHTSSTIAQACIERDDRGGAEEIRKKFVAANPGSLPGWRALAELYVSFGRSQDAADAYEQAAKALSEEGDVEGAVAALNKALEIVPDSQEARVLLERLSSSTSTPAGKVSKKSGEPAPEFETEPREERAETPAPDFMAEPDEARAETPAPDFMAEPDEARAETLSPELAAGLEQEVEESAPAAPEEPDVKKSPTAPLTKPVAEVRAAEKESADLAVTEALVETDVLVKYGLATKAIEQLEGLAKKFPESLELRVRLRDLHRDQGQMSKAANHMLVIADLYEKRGMSDQANEVLRSALDIDPSNADVCARLGLQPARATEAPAAGPTERAALEDFTPSEDLSEKITDPAAAALHEPAPTAFEDFTPPEDLPEITTGTAPETAAPLEETPSPEPTPAGDILRDGFDGGLPDVKAEPSAAAELLPADESLSTQTGPSTDGELAAEAFDPSPGSVEEGPDISETMPPADEGSSLPPHSDEPAKQEPATVEQVVDEPAAGDSVSEIWAEAEFYFQQGLFHEAKKHYARIIQMKPGERGAIERLAELSREEEDSADFAKLAEAVEELEAGPPPGAHAAQELPLSETDEEAVRSLMKEISKLKQAPKQPSPPPVIKQVSEPSPRSAALPEQQYPPQTPQKASAAAGPAKPGGEEGYFDLVAELDADSAAGAPARQEEQPGDFFDLASELRDELGLEAPALRTDSTDSEEEQSLDDIFEEFKLGVEKQIAKEEVDTHYNLGVAYREMGLLDDAIAEFIMTPDDEPKFVQSRHMLGLCYMEKGEYQKAAGEIQSAVDYGEATGEAAHDLIGMRYDLGLAYQGAGNISSALREFQMIQSLDPHYRDVREKIKVLREGDFISLGQLKDDIEKEISAKFLEEDQRIAREEKNRKNEKVRN